VKRPCGYYLIRRYKSDTFIRLHKHTFLAFSSHSLSLCGHYTICITFCCGPVVIHAQEIFWSVINLMYALLSPDMLFLDLLAFLTYHAHSFEMFWMTEV